MITLDLEYHGNASVPILTDPGELDTDYTGLTSCTAKFSIKRDLYKNLPNIYSKHPEFPFIEMSHRTVSLEGPWAIATCKYGGFDNTGSSTPPVYECTSSLKEEPIETHPDFFTIGGTALVRNNDSMWRKIGTNIIAPPTTPDSLDGWVFIGFKAGTKLYGVERYLDPSITWKETVNYRRGSAVLNAAGRIENPRGPAPAAIGDRTWINMGTTMSIHGAAQQTVTEWMLIRRSAAAKLLYG